MVWRLLTHQGNPIDGHAGELWSQTAVNGKRITQVDDSLIAIVVVVMVAWEFIQFTISEKTGARLTPRDAADKERVLESALFRIKKSRLLLFPDKK